MATLQISKDLQVELTPEQRQVAGLDEDEKQKHYSHGYDRDFDEHICDLEKTGSTVLNNKGHV